MECSRSSVCWNLATEGKQRVVVEFMEMVQGQVTPTPKVDER